MTTNKKIESLTKFLRIFSDNENVFIVTDQITGKRFAIAEKNEFNSFDVKSNFMDYKQCEAYLAQCTHNKTELIFKKNMKTYAIINKKKLWLKRFSNIDDAKEWAVKHSDCSYEILIRQIDDNNAELYLTFESSINNE